MGKILNNIIAIIFLMLFLPYTITLLVNGRQGIGQEESLPELEYQVLNQLLQEDYSWMEDGTLRLMAILCRTECIRKAEEDSDRQTEAAFDLYTENYERLYQAVVGTVGQVIMVEGEYRELPYHEISAGHTRAGTLLGEEYSYVLPVDCPLDLESENYLQICSLTNQELQEALNGSYTMEQITFKRDNADYVISGISKDMQWQGEALRTLLHLSSSCFWMKPAEEGVRITVKGRGHGFGISLYTADRMIKEGATVTEIIQKFYENAECITIP